MNKQGFWQELERRADENVKLKQSGMPEWLAPYVQGVGLEFWKIGLLITLLTTMVLRIFAWPSVLRVLSGVFL